MDGFIELGYVDKFEHRPSKFKYDDSQYWYTEVWLTELTRERLGFVVCGNKAGLAHTDGDVVLIANVGHTNRQAMVASTQVLLGTLLPQFQLRSPFKLQPGS